LRRREMTLSATTGPCCGLLAGQERLNLGDEPLPRRLAR
jgi:hypothetical protein